MKIKQKRLEVGELPAFTRPAFTDHLRFPADITQLTAQNLGELMGKYALLLAYVEQEATTWTIAELKEERTLESAEGAFLRDNPSISFLERWRMDLKLKQNLKIQSVRQRLVTIRALKERSLSLVRTYDRLINVLSRELSRKMASVDGSRYSAYNKR